MKRLFIYLLFASIFFFTSCQSKTQSLSCDRFKIGRFEIHSKIDNSTTMIERNDSIQTETNNRTGNVVKARIKWTSNCDYELRYFGQTAKTSDTIIPFVQTRALKTVILKTGKNYCIFKATMEGTDVSMVDTLMVIK